MNKYVRGAEAGFSLVEVVVSMTMLSIGLLGLAGLTSVAAHRATGVSHLTTMSQTVMQQVNRVGVLPYDSLALGTTCRTITDNRFSYTRCVQVDSVQVRVKQITVTITPANSAIKPVTEVFRRTEPPVTHALNR
jgi:prepilin-type N-terminal cleavage/methylation domain-containing protein